MHNRLFREDLKKRLTIRMWHKWRKNACIIARPEWGRRDHAPPKQTS